jgi:FtsH-binding integral membrane protein
MNSFAFTLALWLAFVGCACFYLSSSHQRWRSAPLPARPARTVAALLALASLFAFTRAMNTVPAVFAFVTSVMLLIVVFPYVGALVTIARRVR